MLIGQSGAREPLPRNHRIENFIFFSYSLQFTSHDFDKNGKTMLMEMNQVTTQLESESVLRLMHKKLSQAAPVMSNREQQEDNHHGSEFLTLTKEAIVFTL